MPLGRTSGPNPPNWGNDSVFFWSRLIDALFVIAILGAYLVDGVTGVAGALIQLAIVVFITTRLRARRRRQWERSQGTGTAVA